MLLLLLERVPPSLLQPTLHSPLCTIPDHTFNCNAQARQWSRKFSRSSAQACEEVADWDYDSADNCYDSVCDEPLAAPAATHHSKPVRARDPCMATSSPGKGT